MKNFIQKIVKATLLVTIYLSLSTAFAQAPQKMSYQAVIRNTGNTLISNSSIGMKISILQGSANGTSVYQETQTPITNLNGLVNIEIGNGTSIFGTFTAINWSNGPYFIKTETDPTGGNSYTITGTSQLMSVPYALYAASSGGSNNTWNTTGNAGTNSTTNFIGTTDNNDIVFKRNNILAGRITDLTANSAYGIKSLNSNTTGIGNTATGSGSLLANTVGNYNTACGVGSLQTNFYGIYNTALGFGALRYNEGSNNIGLGVNVETPNPSGNYQMSIGNVIYGADMSSTATGKIGIGIPVPTEKLEVAGKTKTTDLQVTNNAGIGINSPNPTAYGYNGTNKVLEISNDGLADSQSQLVLSSEIVGSGNIGGITFVDKNSTLPEKRMAAITANYNDGSIDDDGDAIYEIGSNINFSTNKNGIFSEKMRIKRDGNVGIGTINPTEKLEVAGKTKTSNLQVTTGAGVGKVLTSDTSGNATWQTATTPNTWGLTGNAGTNPAINFIGTTDDNDIIFKRNNFIAGRISIINTSFGSFSLISNTTGSLNTAIGISALTLNTIGTGNTSIGASSLYNNINGNSNTANGFASMYNNTTGSFNTANGFRALFSNTTGFDNTANGYQALESNTTGFRNTANGSQALLSNTTANYNTATGYRALIYNTTGSDNTAMGSEALFANTGGFLNTAVGFHTLNINSTGNYNTAIGDNALNTVTTGSNNTGLGDNSQVPSATGSNQVRIGNIFVTYVGAQVALSVTSDKRWKNNIQKSSLGLSFINNLNPVSYTRTNDKDKKTEYGFIAQELEETLNNAGASNNGIITKDDAGMLSVRYNDLLAPIVKAIQEQQTIIEKLTKRIEELEKK
jgi:trimeric autotransporter adhesin